MLPDAFASDRERLARFTREAQTLAALNHPNIAAIYGLEESGGIRALVMEFVEGDDLSQLIARRAGLHDPPDTAPHEGAPYNNQDVGRDNVSSVGRPFFTGRHDGLLIDEVLPIAKQIAEALEAAHELHIIHRDLKPANIKVRPDGVVKVLDFGLAKAMEPPDPAYVPLSQMPTITSPAMMTGAGMILGTAAYMSPEQAKGRSVDKRADIWAFGVVVYEMLTGQRLFEAEDASETLAAVLTRDLGLTALPGTTPARVRGVVRDCLVRDPRQRLRDIGEARRVLEAVIAGTPDARDGARDEARAGVGVHAAPLPSVSPGRRALPWTVAGISSVALVAALVAWAPWQPAPVLPETRTEIVTPATDSPASFALSPDGRQIVFVASGDGTSRLWLRSLATATAQPLAGTEGATDPFWSPDGRSVAFFASGVLKRLDLGGEAQQTLVPSVNGQGGTWNADGVVVFAPSPTTPLMRGSASGGAATAMTTLGPRQQGHVWPHFLPDGRRFLFYVRGAPDTAGIYLGALDGSAPTRLTAADSAGRYLPAEASGEGGWLLWARAGTLVAQRLDVAQAALTGELVALADGVVGDVLFFRSAVSVAPAGLVAYRTGGGSQRQLTWVDRSGTARGTVGDPDDGLTAPRLSGDGRRVVVDRTVRGNRDIWLLDGARTGRITFDAAPDGYPIWSPDDARIVFRSLRTGAGDLYQRFASGAGVEERLVTSEQQKTPSSWSADGRFLLFHSNDPRTGADLWVMPMEGDHKPSIFLKTPFREIYSAFSPDGRWVAYQSDESGRPEIYVRPFVPPSRAASADKPGGQWQVSTAGGITPVWRPDGKELFYLSPVGAMMATPITATGDTFTPGAPLVLFPTRIYGAGVDKQQGPQFAIAPDGRFLINTELDSAAAPITLIQHWNPEAKR